MIFFTNNINGILILTLGKHDYKKSKKEVKSMKNKADMKSSALGITVIFTFYCYCSISITSFEINFRNDNLKCGISYVYSI